MHADTELVIKVQGLDQQIATLEKEIATLPKHIAAIEKTLDSHIRRLDADKAALTANVRDRKKLEGDIQVHDQKISKLKDQMLGAKTNEQYKAFQHEIEYAQKEIRKCEDRILELMSESEPLDVNVKKAEGALKEEKAVVDGEKNRARDRTAADEKMLGEGRRMRQDLLDKLAPATLSAYQKIRKKWNGAVIAEAVNSRCSACQIVLRPQYVQDLRRGEQLMFCESCGRILFIHPPVSFDDSNGPRATTQAG
jgi:uncharacterized protein